MTKFCCVVVWTLVFTSCWNCTVSQRMAAPSVEVTEVTITVSGPGRYGAGLEVYPSGKVTGSDIDGTPNPFAHMYETKLSEQQAKRIFDLAKAVLSRDPGKDPIIDRNNIVYVVVKTSDGKWHTYFRDLKGTFPIDELNELDQMLKAVDIGPTIHWP